MGNYVTVTCRPSNTGAGKVILWDGSVQEFSWPLTAAELMLEHPQHFVAELHAAVNEKRSIPLPADQKLDMKKVYVMLPLKRGKPTTLSSEEARRVLLSANSLLRSKSLLLPPSKFLPWFAGICPTVNVEEIGRRQRFPSQKKDDGGDSEIRHDEVRCLTEFLAESVELARPEYLNRQISGKGTWKPSLDTIKEKKVERKVSHWLF